MKQRIAKLTAELRVLTAGAPSLDMLITNSMASYALALAKMIEKSSMLKGPRMEGSGKRMNQAWVHLKGPIGSYRVDAMYAPKKDRIVVSVTSHARTSRDYDAMLSETPDEAARGWMRKNETSFAIETPPAL